MGPDPHHPRFASWGVETLLSVGGAWPESAQGEINQVLSLLATQMTPVTAQRSWEGIELQSSPWTRFGLFLSF